MEVTWTRRRHTAQGQPAEAGNWLTTYLMGEVLYLLFEKNDRLGVV